MVMYFYFYLYIVFVWLRWVCKLGELLCIGVGGLVGFGKIVLVVVLCW